MPKYVIAYLGGKQVANPEARAAQMARWKAWVALDWAAVWSIPECR